MSDKILGEGGGTEMEELYTMEEITARLKVTRETLYNYMKKGIIPFVKIGGQRRFIGSQVAQAIKNLQKSQMVERLRSADNMTSRTSS